MSGGIDYSQWDKMANEMSDSEDDDNNNDPVVTTFDQPQAVTFGGTEASQAEEGWDNGGLGHDPSSAPAPENGSAVQEGGETTAPSVGAAGAKGGVTGSTASRTPKIAAPTTDAQLTENGGRVLEEQSSGGQRLSYVWRQAREEVVFVVPAPPGTRAADVKVSLRAKPDTIAEGVADVVKVVVVQKGGRVAPGEEEEEVVLLEGELMFQVKFDEGDDADWELKDLPGTIVARDGGSEHGGDRTTVSGDGQGLSGKHADSSSGRCNKASSLLAGEDRRGIEVTLNKHCPIPNATVWWKSLLKGAPEIDISSIQGRAKNNHQSVWEEALGMFKENVAARKAKGKISVDMGDGE